MNVDKKSCIIQVVTRSGDKNFLSNPLKIDCISRYSYLAASDSDFEKKLLTKLREAYTSIFRRLNAGIWRALMNFLIFRIWVKF